MKTTDVPAFSFSCYGWGFCSPDLFIPRGASYALFTRHDLTVGGNPLAVASADFNGDGKQDIAVLFGPTGATTNFCRRLSWKWRRHVHPVSGGRF